MWKIIFIKGAAIVLVMSATLGLCSCNAFTRIKEKPSPAQNLPQPNPHDGIHYESSVEMYYRFCNTSYLVPRIVDVEFSSNVSAEETMVRVLLSENEEQGIYNSAIPKGIELVSIIDSGDILFVTLNSEFLNDDIYTNPELRRIAVCQIVNTLTAYSDKSVQILVDRSNSGMGERVSYEELGFEKKHDEHTDYAAAFNFTMSIVITPTAMVDYAINCIKNGEYEYAALLFERRSGDTEVTADEIKEVASRYQIKECEVLHVEDSEYDNTAKAFVNLTFEKTDNDKTYTFEGGIELLKFEPMYKISYDSFIECIEGV